MVYMREEKERGREYTKTRPWCYCARVVSCTKLARGSRARRLGRVRERIRGKVLAAATAAVEEAAAELYRCPGAFAIAGTHAGRILRTSGMPLLSLQFPGPLHRQDRRRRPPPPRAPPPRLTTGSLSFGHDLHARFRELSIARANSSVHFHVRNEPPLRTSECER